MADGQADARDVEAALRRGGRRRRPHPRAARPVGDATSSRSTATGRCGSSSTTTGSRSSRSAASRRMLSRRGSRRRSARWAIPTSGRCSSTPSAPTCARRRSGRMDPDERLELLDAEGIDAAVLYTTVGLLWEAELEDPELSQAYTRAYNRWICEFCADADRLVPTAHLSLGDPAAAAHELERAVGEGAKGALRASVHPRRPTARPPRQRPGVRRRPGPRRALRHPPDVRAAVDQGHAHGCVGERQASCGCWPRSRRPTACATSSRRCSTTACSTGSRS